MAEDIVERLREMLPKAGTADGDVNAVFVGIIADAADEIERLRADIVALRSLAGCVEIPLKSFADIKKEIRNG